MINKLPIIGWLFSLGASISISIPFWFIWNKLAPIYFSSYVPEKFLNVPFWHCVGLFIIIPIVRDLLTPKFCKVSNSCDCNKS